MDHQTFFPEGTHDNLSKLSNVFQRQAHRRNTVMHKRCARYGQYYDTLYISIVKVLIIQVS